VLIIDDNSDLAGSLRRLLEQYGCSVEVARDGKEGVSKAIAGMPDVVIVDIVMPGMTGYEVARLLRQRLPYHAILIAQTAYGLPEDREKALACGFDQHLMKPAEPGRLIREIVSARRISH
jgi:CheY-like chemotaxis protein